MTGATQTFDPFRILSDQERRAHLEGYLRYLGDRDGDIDLGERRLSGREGYFEELERKPVSWDGDLDLEGFHRHVRGHGKPAIDARTVWLVAVAKANLGEAFGVEIELARFLSRPEEAKRADPRHLYLLMEEHYHTRILAELCRTCGIEPETAQLPAVKRLVILGMMHLPQRLRWILIFAGEALGAEVFRRLREETHLFSEQPEVEERLRALLREIWIDEMLHVAYLRARLGPWAVRLARWLLPVVAWSVMRDVPEVSQLGWERRELLERIREGFAMPDLDWLPREPIPTT